MWYCTTPHLRQQALRAAGRRHVAALRGRDPPRRHRGTRLGINYSSKQRKVDRRAADQTKSSMAMSERQSVQFSNKCTCRLPLLTKQVSPPLFPRHARLLCRLLLFRLLSLQWLGVRSRAHPPRARRRTSGSPFPRPSEPAGNPTAGARTPLTAAAAAGATPGAAGNPDAAAGAGRARCAGCAPNAAGSQSGEAGPAGKACGSATRPLSAAPSICTALLNLIPPPAPAFPKCAVRRWPVLPQRRLATTLPGITALTVGLHRASIHDREFNDPAAGSFIIKDEESNPCTINEENRRTVAH